MTASIGILGKNSASSIKNNKFQKTFFKGDFVMKKLWLNEREYVLFNDAPRSISNEIATRNRSLDFYSIIQNLYH